MSILFSILIILVSVILSLVVLMQNAKGGLNEGMGSVTQVAGVRASNEIEKITWGLIIALVVLCIGSTISISSGSSIDDGAPKSEIQEFEENNGVPVDVQSLPAPDAGSLPQPAPGE